MSEALRVAIDLVHMPSRVRHTRSKPLPDGVLILLRVVAGEDEAAECAAESIARSSGLVREAAVFFIEQIMLSPDADSYRVLGARPEATSGELRRNMILLLKWLHPDARPREARSVFAGRVILAWSDLKTPQRRAAYDAMRSALPAKKTGPAKTAGRGLSPTHSYTSPLSKRVHFGQYPNSHRSRDTYRASGRLRRALLMLLGGSPSREG